jgi:hypothetical protein
VNATCEMAAAASAYSHGTFTYVFVPATVSDPLTERSASVADTDAAISCMTDLCKAHFQRVKDIRSMSPEARAASMAEMRAQIAAKHPGVTVSDAQIESIFDMNMVDTVPLIVNKKAGGFIGVNMYVDDQGQAKQLPVRAYGGD